MIIGLLQTARQLLGYGLIATFLFQSWFGYFCLLMGLFALLRNRYALIVWISLDYMACAVCHGVLLRTISSWTGQHMNQSKRYRYQAYLIDWLAELFGDLPNHCEREYQIDLKRGLVR